MMVLLKKSFFVIDEILGILLCPVLTTRDGDKPFMLVLNAKNMTELARCYVEHRLPFSFHAHFVENKKLEKQ